MIKTVSILTLSLALFSACQAEPTVDEKSMIIIPSDSSQLLMVTTADWNTKDGELQRYEREEKNWKKVGTPINIVLGRNGLGWGVGLHSIPKDAKYIKKEGDGKAPAGLFALGNGFGYEKFKIDFPYSVYKQTDHCIDDSKSEFYNTIVDSTKIKKDYKSFEHMRLKNNLYKYGITVNHNPNQVANAGSCIFMHIKSKSGGGTAGCTAMKEGAIITILKWLKKDKKPLLLQLPQEEVAKKIADDSLK
ncbi:Gll0911 protein [hydrothermal vent metagenome]|uniref:Gll0911 protein n=1 Tax=hydrothermal vent metagenome TaxID=652676 RepID=A0A1W1BYG9_9ZZZZ